MPDNASHAGGGSEDAGLSEADTISAEDLALAAEALAGLLPEGMCLTANGAACHDGSGSACVDLFSQASAASAPQATPTPWLRKAPPARRR